MNEALTCTKPLPGSIIVRIVSYLAYRIGGWLHGWITDPARLDVDAVGDLPLQTPPPDCPSASGRLRSARWRGRPTQIDRRDQQRVVTVGANLESGSWSAT